FSYTVGDGNGGFANATVHITVLHVNHPPTITAPANRTNAEADVITSGVTVTGSDPDSDPLTFGASNLPAGLTINPTTGAITGTISYVAAAGSPYTVTVSVSDGTAPPVTATFIWTVSNTNRAPSVTAPANRTNAEGDVITAGVTVTGSDPDSDPLTFGASNLPAGLTINPTTGAITGTITYAAPFRSPYTVTVSASDGTAPPTTATFTWTVSNTNRAPSVTAPANRTNAEGD